MTISNRIELGQRVRDPVSGFEGIAVSRHEYIHGCERINIQPECGEDKKLPTSETFDALGLEIIGAGVTHGLLDKVSRALRGGPEKHSDTGRETPSVRN